MSDISKAIIVADDKLPSASVATATHRRKTKEFWTRETIFIWFQIKRAPMITTVVHLSVIALFSSLFSLVANIPELHGIILIFSILTAICFCGARFFCDDIAEVQNDGRFRISLHLSVIVSLVFISVSFLHNHIIIPGIATTILTALDASVLSSAFQHWLKEEADTTD